MSMYLPETCGVGFGQAVFKMPAKHLGRQRKLRARFSLETHVREWPARGGRGSPKARRQVPSCESERGQSVRRSSVWSQRSPGGGGKPEE